MILYSLFSCIKTGKNANKGVTYWEPWTIHCRAFYSDEEAFDRSEI